MDSTDYSIFVQIPQFKGDILKGTHNQKDFNFYTLNM